MTRLWLPGLLFALLACAQGGHAGARGPSAALRAYVEAVRAKDAKKAYALLGEDIRGRFEDQASFEAFFSKNYQEIVQEAEALFAAAGGLRQEAEVVWEGGEAALLMQEPEGWRVFREPPLLRGETPLETLQALALLARQRSAGGMFAPYLSYEAREERAACLLAFASLLEEVEERDITQDGEQAVARLQDGRELRFKKQQGRWLLYTLPQELIP